MALVVPIVFPGFSGFDDHNVFISALNFYKKKMCSIFVSNLKPPEVCGTALVDGHVPNFVPLGFLDFRTTRRTQPV